MIEILAQVSAPHFTAGLVLRKDMKRGKWTRDQVRAYCRKKRWQVSVVHEVRSKDSAEAASKR